VTTTRTRRLARRTAAAAATALLAAGAVFTGASAHEVSSTTAQVSNRIPSSVPKVTNLRYASHGTSSDGYDRVVIDFKGKATGYDVRYVSSPTHCGSGNKVSVPGTRFLQVTVRPAHAHTDSGANTYLGPGRLSAKSTGLPTLKGVRMTCDFEGHVSFVLGLDHKAGFHVSRLSDPTRLYVDIAH
jgi:hypothetical protein